MAFPGAASRSIVLLIVVVGVTTLVGSDANGDSKAVWEKFDLKSQGLSVLMPGIPKTKVARILHRNAVQYAGQP